MLYINIEKNRFLNWHHICFLHFHTNINKFLYINQVPRKNYTVSVVPLYVLTLKKTSLYWGFLTYNINLTQLKAARLNSLTWEFLLDWNLSRKRYQKMSCNKKEKISFNKQKNQILNQTTNRLILYNYFKVNS